ncbi:MAG: hypothetical protein JEZ01_21095 [Labilibaculum sp.]|nr:hypothetical protein [Labilibaculum sp.]MBI9060277.1 hypothetical protein [Labilibaculum sp.]
MYKFLFIVFFSLSVILNAQQKSIPSNPKAAAVEIYLLGNDPTNPSKSIPTTMTAVGTVWETNYESSTQTYTTLKVELTSNFKSLSYSTSCDNQVHSGFEWNGSDNFSDQQFGYGKYVLAFDLGNESAVCTLDYRDDRYGYYNATTGHDADVWIKYDL